MAADVDVGTSDGASPGTGAGAVLDVLRRHGPASRRSIAALAGISRPTASSRLDALIATGLVVPAGDAPSTGGRPAELFTIDVEAGRLLVLDTGGSGARIALCDLAGRVLDSRHVTHRVADGPEPVLQQLDAEADVLLAGDEHPALWGVGVSVAGPVEQATGRVTNPPIMTGWDGFDLRSYYEARYGTPVVVENDVNVMAVGEQRTAYPRAELLLMLKVGTGVGAGIVSSGRLLRGAAGAAGDLGHTHASPPDPDDDEPVCRCGNVGCVEAYAGGWALVRDLAAAGREVSDVDGVVRLVRAGDEAAVRLARRAGRVLGQATAYAVSLLNPTILVVGGQLAAEDHLLAGLREQVYRRPLPLATHSLQVVRSQLEPLAGVAGLAMLLADEVLSPGRVEERLAP